MGTFGHAANVISTGAELLQCMCRVVLGAGTEFMVGIDQLELRLCLLISASCTSVRVSSHCDRMQVP